LALPVEGLVVETRIVDATLIPRPPVPSLIRLPLISSPLIAPLVIFSAVAAIALVAISVVIMTLALLPTRLAWIGGRNAHPGSQSDGGQAQHCGDRARGHIPFHVHRALLCSHEADSGIATCSKAISVNRDSFHAVSLTSGLTTMSGGGYESRRRIRGIARRLVTRSSYVGGSCRSVTRISRNHGTSSLL
jgi:hypothetical protein